LFTAKFFKALEIFHLKISVERDKAAELFIVAVSNDHMTFFDISKVTVPADRIAFSLLKVASANQVVSGAELAENETLYPPILDGYADLSLEKLSSKLASLSKLSDIEKEVQGIVSGKSKKDDKHHRLTITFHKEVRPDIEDEDIAQLKSAGAGVDDVLGGLTSSGICLNVSEFAKVILGDKYYKVASIVHEAESVLPGIYTRALEDFNGKSEVLKNFELGTSLLSRSAREKIAELTPTHSITKSAVDSRAVMAAIRKLSIEKTAGVAGGTANVSPAAGHLANLYSRYKLAFLTHSGALTGDDFLAKMAVMQNYVI